MTEDPITNFTGGCHCGGLSVELRTSVGAAELQPRACDCSFCAKHAAAWVSDPRGRLAIIAHDRELLGEYRQGSGTARLLFCRGCGVLVAVVHEAESGLHGAANSLCLEGVSFRPAEVVSPQHLDATAKKARWGELWFRQVEVKVLVG